MEARLSSNGGCGYASGEGNSLQDDWGEWWKPKEGTQPMLLKLGVGIEEKGELNYLVVGLKSK